MLATYQTRTNQLLQYPAASPPLYALSDITGWINQARGQLAGEAECIRVMATLAITSSGGSVYPFSALNLAGASGVQGVLNVRQTWYQVASGQARLTSRPWEWFSLYNFNNPVPVAGPPDTWAQFGQGVNGTIYIDPPPDQNYTLLADCVCYPVSLASDTDPEAIPYLWTDAVPYFAAYLALLSSQSGARDAQAQRMMQLYEQFVNRARQIATPSVLPGDYSQQPNIVQAGILGQANAQARGR